MDGVFSKSDPFYVIKRMNPDGTTWNTVHKSSIIRNNLNPQWPPDTISLQTLCNGDVNRKLQIQLVDWDRDGSHDDMGCIETTVAELVDKGRGSSSSSSSSFQVTRTTRRGKSKKAGTLTVRHARIVNQTTMLDYITGGCQLSLMVAVDFTLSNGRPSNSMSLHRQDPTKWNDYQRAISKIGVILQEYDTDKLFPIWGFGAKINSVAQPCFPLMQHEVYGAQGLLDAYNQTFSIPGFDLSGPTNFSPVLKEAYGRAMRAKQRMLVDPSKQEYCVLVILTDGVITDMAKTIDIICHTTQTDAPLSIVIVGVGKADFADMDKLDGDGGQRLRGSKGQMAKRDIVQFVPFRKFGGSAERLAAETLCEIPDQLLEYFKQVGIPPNPPIPAPEFTDEEIFLDPDDGEEDIVVGGGGGTEQEIQL
uniref:C2 domain-containing protein n=1 Tax=Cyclophora tenuis TaxID=216820 RepID=A0A6U1QQM2_CYCTE|mmetsp:Transcript_19026/g.32582  ORF Transcript_19026/g.32582 Transcript_19026/m.32582 type:complete len:419 (+) Transcript_19026:374-1630(+)